MSSREQPQPQRDRPPAHHLHVGLASHNLHLLARSLISSSACCSRGIAPRFDSGHLRSLRGLKASWHIHLPCCLLPSTCNQEVQRRENRIQAFYLFSLSSGADYTRWHMANCKLPNWKRTCMHQPLCGSTHSVRRRCRRLAHGFTTMS